MKTSVVLVALRLALPRPLEYLARDELDIYVGSVVRVTIRGKPMRGIVVAIAAKPTIARNKLRTIDAVEAALGEDQLDLCEFVHRYYRAPIGMAYALALPPVPVAEKRGKTAPQVLADETAAQKKSITLNDEQHHAATTVIASLGAHHVFTLRGITGSGKTEVYVAAIREALARGEQALVLVPEINLTPQWMARLVAQLPAAQIVALHSALSDGERYRAWRAAASGEAQLIFGTRLSVFVPLPKLGLIVVDEEHDASFKQQETPRYHARDLAVLRAQKRGVPIVLGSATPSLETFANTVKGRYRALQLKQRAHRDARPPEVLFVPARDAQKNEGVSLQLLSALDACVARGEQSLIFINRRGFSPVIHCDQCSWQAQCVDCDARMVFHSFDQKLRCHHCAATAKVPRACPECGNDEINPQGGGTQRIEAFLRRRYSKVIVVANAESSGHEDTCGAPLSAKKRPLKIARADADSTRGKHDWLAIYSEMAAGEIDILVGTQMIAKGHDFPRLTLVGVIGADDALFSADFRAPERLFCQLTQVAGRAGRAALPGAVVIQTDMPEHPVYQALRADDFAAFAQRELSSREAAGLPPAKFLAIVRAESSESDIAEKTLKKIYRALDRFEAQHPGLERFPVVPSPLARRATKYRWQMLLIAADRAQLRNALHEVDTIEIAPEVLLSVDVDPLDLT